MSGFGNAVSYALSLESKQFLDGLRAARAEAKKAARDIQQSGQQGARGLAGLGQAGKSAADALKTFSAAGNAFAQALSGNLVGAATNAATAVKGLTAAMQANPVMLLVSALAALGQVLGAVASKWSEYRQRVADAAEEHERFVRHLRDMAFGDPAEQYVESHVSGFKSVVDEGNVTLSQEILESQRREVEERRRDAEKASEKLRQWEGLNPKGQFTYDDATSAFGYVHVTGEEGAARAKAERDAAEEAYRRQLEILRGYEAVLSKQDSQQAEADARAKRIAAEAAEASAAEMERRAAALAEGDEEAMRQHLEKMRAAVDEKFGPEADYEDRLKSGTASREEVAARRSVEDYGKRIAAVVASEAAKVAGEAERERQRAAAAWTESRQADERLDRSRESALVAGGDAKALREWSERLGREADVRFGPWSAEKTMTATQDELDARATVARMTNEAQQIDERRRAGDEHREERLLRFREEKAEKMGDYEKLMELAKKRWEAANKKWGEAFLKRVEAGTVTVAEMEQREAAERLREKAVLMRTQEQTRAAEEQSERERVAQELSSKAVGFLRRNDTDAEKLRRNSKQLKKAMADGDIASAIDLMLEGEQIADSYQEEMSPSQKRRAERRARREQRAALREARKYRRQVSRIEKAFASGKISEEDAVAAIEERNDGVPSPIKMKNGRLIKVEGTDRTNQLLEEVVKALS